MREAKEVAGGKRLGPVGGRIVAEVFAGLLMGDPTSYANCDPRWTPEREKDKYGLAGPVMGDDWQFRDIIAAAGMPIEAGDFSEEQANAA